MWWVLAPFGALIVAFFLIGFADGWHDDDNDPS